MVGLFLLFCVGGCEEPEDQMETEVENRWELISL
jgi:hypothetical protein